MEVSMGTESELSEQDLKLTAALYATRRSVVEQVRTTGRLPERIPTGGAHIGMRLLIERRGRGHQAHR